MIKLKIFQIDFTVSVGFMGVLCLTLYSDRSGLSLPTFLAITIHEIGHLIALFAFNAKPKRIELKLGAVGIIGSYTLTEKQEIEMLLAGSIFNIIAFVFFLVLYLSFHFKTFVYYSLVMLIIGVFNLLPVNGLDGGQVILIVISKYFKQKTVEIIGLLFSCFIIVAIIALGIMFFLNSKENISLILFGVYLFLGILMSKKKNDCNICRNVV